MISTIDSSSIITAPVEASSEGAEGISLEQLQYLVRLVDQSDIVELEVTYSGTRVHLVGRAVGVPQSERYALPTDAPGREAEPRRSTLTAPSVGLFQSWSKAQNKPLVAVGDVVKDGQLVAMIRSLGIPNEVESSVAGRVVELLVEEGQPIEYGQPLMVIEDC